MFFYMKTFAENAIKLKTHITKGNKMDRNKLILASVKQVLAFQNKDSF